MKIGIQGGPGSFNEQSAVDYCKKNRIDEYSLRYLYTTKGVFDALLDQNVDLGHFAVCNSRGGLVQESIDLIASHTFQVHGTNVIPIHHFLMKKPGTTPTKIIAHPQVLTQCKNNLELSFPDLRQETGQGDLLDTARAAKAIAHGELGENYAVLGPKVLADLYGFETVSDNLADDNQNKTSFIVISINKTGN